jgi:hypothetical protein
LVGRGKCHLSLMPLSASPQISPRRREKHERKRKENKEKKIERRTKIEKNKKETR